MPDEDDYEETPLYGGDTRPAVVRWVGLPITAGVPLAMAIPMIVNLFHDWATRFVLFGVWVAVAVFLWAMIRDDHNKLRIFWRWLQTKFGSFDARKWLGATPDPFPVRLGKTPHGIYDD